MRMRARSRCNNSLAVIIHAGIPQIFAPVSDHDRRSENFGAGCSKQTHRWKNDRVMRCISAGERSAFLWDKSFSHCISLSRSE